MQYSRIQLKLRKLCIIFIGSRQYYFIQSTDKNLYTSYQLLSEMNFLFLKILSLPHSQISIRFHNKNSSPARDLIIRPTFLERIQTPDDLI